MQLIFRKVADVKREQELAERRKNEPPVADLAQDHLVRKIFSKFRKPSDAGSFPSRPTSTQTAKVAPKPSTDVEAATKERRESGGELVVSKMKVPQAADQDSGSESRASTAKGKMSRWAAAMGSPTETRGAESEEKEEKDGTANRRTELVCRKSEHIHVVKDVRPPAQGNKWPKVSIPRPDTIDENGEITGDGTIDAGSRPRASVTSLVPISKAGISPADLQNLVSTLLEIKVDIKSEIQKVNSRISRIDQQVEDVSNRLMAAHQQMLDKQKRMEETAALEAEGKSKKKEKEVRSQEKSPRSRTSSKLASAKSHSRHSKETETADRRVKSEKESGAEEDLEQDLTSKL